MKAKWPAYFLIVLVFLIPIAVSPAAFDQYGTPKLALFIILSGFLCGISMIYPKRLNHLPLFVKLTLLFFLSVQFLQMIRLPNFWRGFFGEYGQSESFLVQIGFILIFVSGFLLLDHESVIMFMRRVACCAVLIASLYGLYEYFWGDPVTHTVVTRVKSFLGDPNSLGVFLVLSMPLLFWELIRPSSRFFQSLCAIAIFLGSANLLLTFSRAAWFGFLVSMLVILLFAIPFLKKRLFQTVLLFCLLFLGFTAGEVATHFQHKSHLDYDLPARINSVAQGNDSGRGLLWPIAWRTFKASPFWGYGLGTFQDSFHRYQNTAALEHWGPERDLRQAHNEILQYLATQGMLGFLSYLGLIIAFFWTIRSSLACRPALPFLVPLLAAVCGYLIFMQFAYPLVHYSCLFWLYWGIMIRFNISDSLGQSVNWNFKPGQLFFMGVLLGCAVWMGFRIYQADVYYQKAFNLGHIEKYRHSLVYFPKMIALNPWMYQYKYRYALTFIRTARRTDRTYQSSLSRQYLRKAMKILDELVLSYPKRYEIPFYQGRIEEYQRHYSRASRYYQIALRLYPLNYKTWFRLAVSERYLNKNTAAFIAWKAGYKINRSYMQERLKVEHLPFIFSQ